MRGLEPPAFLHGKQLLDSGFPLWSGFRSGRESRSAIGLRAIRPRFPHEFPMSDRERGGAAAPDVADRVRIGHYPATAGATEVGASAEPRGGPGALLGASDMAGSVRPGGKRGRRGGGESER